MSKVKINLVDQTLIGNDSLVAASAKCGTGEDNHRHPKLVEYVRNQDSWDGISYFTDKALPRAAEVESKYKVGLILEAWILDPQAYKDAVEYEDHFDYIFTYNPELLSKNPDKYKFFPADTICIDVDSMKIQPKSKMISMTYSTKRFLPGHIGRHEIVENILPKVTTKVDLYGSGSEKKIKMKSDALRDYMFSIEMENAYLQNYFTEKLLDCFATGTVPIYAGCPNIEQYFNPDGIIQYTNLRELMSILDSLDEATYHSKKKAIEENYNIAMDKYLHPDDSIYEKVIAYERERNNGV